MKTFTGIIVFILFSSMLLYADNNIEKYKYHFALDEGNNVNVVRLKNDQGIVSYILELYLDAWEIDSPDCQLGGSLCIRINKAGGRYIPGCLLCKKDSRTTYLPIDCLGVFSKEMLEEGFQNSKRGVPIIFEGSGMRIFLTISKLEFSNEPVPRNREQKVKNLEFEMEFIPDSSIPISKEFIRKGLKK